MAKFGMLYRSGDGKRSTVVAVSPVTPANEQAPDPAVLRFLGYDPGPQPEKRKRGRPRKQR